MTTPLYALLGRSYSVPTPPRITSLSPDALPLSGGAFSISGVAFTGATLVRVAGASVPFQIVSDTVISATAPAHAMGPATVDVTTPGGVATSPTPLQYVPPPILSSVTPNESGAGMSAFVHLRGQYLSNLTALALVLNGNSFPFTNTIVDDDENVDASPSDACPPGTYDVVATTVGGTATLAGAFAMRGQPYVATIAPNAGPLAGGQTVTINGSGFTGAHGATLGGAPLTSFAVLNDGTITGVTPVGVEGLADVVVSNVAFSGTLARAYTYRAIPVVTGITPAAGPLGGGQLVTIKGSKFTGESAPLVGGAPIVAWSFIDDGTISGKTAAHAAGATDVSVTTAGGTGSQAGAYAFVPAPTIASVTPSRGPGGGGTQLTITGTALATVSSVTVGGAAAMILSGATDTQLQVSTPPGTAGARDVVVTTAGGSTTAAGAFTYGGAPTITSVTPASGPTAGGTSIAIVGTGFTYATSVTFDGVAATSFAVVSDTRINAVAPPHAAASVALQITTDYGSTSAPYAYVLPASITSVTPASGPTTGGQQVTIAGAGFLNASGVTFGSLAASSVAVQNDSSIAATTPAASAGTKDVTVTAPGGAGTKAAAYTFVPKPSITGISPVRGNVAGGGTITITGSSLSNAQSVTVDGVAAQILSGSTDSQIQISAPAHAAGAAAIVVTTPGGASGAATYTYGATPTISSVAPARAASSGGTQVTIAGSGFTYTSAVTIGGAVATIVSATDAQIVTTAPAHAAGAADVVVTTDFGPVTSAAAVTYQDVPTVTSITPANTQKTAYSGTIKGTGFTAASQVQIGASNAATYNVVDDSTINVTQSSTALATGDNAIKVVTPGGSTTFSPGLHVYAVPSITSVSVNSSPFAGGRSVVITGSGFTDVTSVKFAGVSARNFVINSSTQITAITDTWPSGSAGSGSVSVSGGGGTASALTFYYDSAPTLTSISPASGMTAGGATLTLTGAAFSNGGRMTITSITIGGTACSGLTFVSDTQITVLAPAKAAGTFDVVATSETGETATLAGAYTAVAPPAINTITPASGSANGGTAVTIAGSGFQGLTSVTIGGVALTGAVASSDGTTITGTTGPHAAASADIVVTSASGTTTKTAAYSYTSPPAPTVSSMTPSTGVMDGGQTVTFVGANFQNPQAVTFGGTAATNISVSPDGTTLTCTTPNVGAPGAMNATITTYGGSVTRSFTFYRAHTITAVSPNSSPEAGGSTITITGTQFQSSGMGVQIGGVACTSVTYVSATQLTAVVPAKVAGVYNVTVTGPSGVTATLANGFTYVHVQKLLASVDFTTFAVGEITASQLATLNLTFSRMAAYNTAFTPTVQTSGGALAVLSSGSAAGIGNLTSTAAKRGLSINQTRRNQHPYAQQRGSGTTKSGLTETLNYASAGSPSGDNGETSEVGASAGAYAFYNTFSGANPGYPMCFSCWKYSGSGSRQITLGLNTTTAGTDVAALGTSSSWERLSIAAPSNTVNNKFFVTDGRDESAQGGRVAQAVNELHDYVQQEINTFPTDFVIGSSSTGANEGGGLLAYTSQATSTALVTADHQVRMRLRCTMKHASTESVWAGDYNGNAVTVAEALFSAAASGYAAIRQSDRKMVFNTGGTSGTTVASTAAMVWNRNDEMEMFVALGGNVGSAALYRRNKGLWTDLGLSTPLPDAGTPFSSMAQMAIASFPSAFSLATAGNNRDGWQLPSWIHGFAFYGQGCTPLVVTSISTATTPAAGGASITLTGQALGTTNSVKVNGTVATITSVTASTVTFTAPAGVVGATTIIVADADEAVTYTGILSYV